ncbi:MAG: hypothetical protein SH868_01045 [Bythopirellula sp.]|nr:hypothetical protein [Bythopirellula sp.]
MSNVKNTLHELESANLPFSVRAGAGDREEARVVHILSPGSLSPLLENIHPACDCFWISDDEITSMVESLKLSGPRHPIEVLDDQLLDGRRRIYAALKLQLSLPAIYLCHEDLGQLSPFEYALKANRAAGCGRQLTPIKIALAAVRYHGMWIDELKESALQRKKKGVAASPAEKGETLEHAAAKLGVSVRALSIAMKVFRTNDPSLYLATHSGKISLAEVERLVFLSSTARQSRLAELRTHKTRTPRTRPLKAKRSGAEVAEDLQRESESIRKYLQRVETVIASNPDVAFDLTSLKKELGRLKSFIAHLAERFSSPNSGT